MTKTYNIYAIKDQKIVSAREGLANAMKYFCETNGRKKDRRVVHSDPFGYYNNYIIRFNELSREYALNPLDYSPDEFYKALMSDEVDLDEVVREFLQAVARYLVEKKKHDVKVVFLPFYFDQSFERYYFKEDGPTKYFEYIRDKVISEMKYTVDELKEQMIEEEWGLNKFKAAEEVNTNV